MAKPDPDRIRKWGQLAGIGPLLATAVVLGWYVGSKLDQWLGTAPWLMVLGVLLGTAGGFIELVRLLADLGETGKKPGRRGSVGEDEKGGES
jgi:ATP synthase protein I